MRYFQLRPKKAPKYTGQYRARYRWYLPGITCPACHATWSADIESWPCVDLTDFDEWENLEGARLEEDYAEFERLRKRLRQRVPSGALLYPGTPFGPLVGNAQGRFGDIFMQYPWALLMQREAIERLQAEGVRALVGGPTQFRFRQKSAPQLMELQLEPRGRLHRDCLPENPPEPCAQCGRWGISLPEQPVLVAATLPADMDVFRLADFPTVVVGSERLMDAVQRLGLEEVDFLELPLR